MEALLYRVRPHTVTFRCVERKNIKCHPIVAVIAAIGMVSGPISPTTTAPHPAETIAEEYGGGGNTGNDVSPFI